MSHKIDDNDLAYIQERYGTPVAWNPGVVDKKTGRINPHLTQVALKSGETVSVFHIKPVYYEDIAGNWRPLSEVAEYHGNRTLILNSSWWKIHPRYMRWLQKRTDLLSGTFLITTPFKTYPTPYIGITRAVHDSILPQKLGLTTTTAYPDPDTETTSVDGYAGNNTPATWAVIRAAAGNFSADSNTVFAFGWDASGGGSTPISYMYRQLFVIDTAGIPDGETIDSATISVYGTSKLDPGGNGPSANIYSSTPASNTAIANGDFQNVGSTEFSSSIAYASWSTSGYNDFALNATGIAAISKTGVSKFSFRNANYDVAATSPSTGTAETGVKGASAETAGTTSDPKIVVVSSAASGPAGVKTWNGLAQASVKTVNGLAIASVKTANGLA